MMKKIEWRQIEVKATGSPSIQGVKGNLRFPLDITYHGCPRISFGS